MSNLGVLKVMYVCDGMSVDEWMGEWVSGLII